MDFWMVSGCLELGACSCSQTSPINKAESALLLRALEQALLLWMDAGLLCYTRRLSSLECF